MRMLPERIDRSDLLAALPAGWPPPADASPATRLSVPIGIDESELAPVSVDFTDHPHLLIFGDSECGKTNLLRGLCRGLVEAGSGAQTRIIVGDYRRTLLGVVGGDHLGDMPRRRRSSRPWSANSPESSSAGCRAPTRRNNSCAIDRGGPDPKSSW
ncbi:hypothetical protein NJ76_15725 [Rhodococcus sp. IITR03]|nr:hypothetical protein NJ76_15725 [Rhodococcus sp. IITR03]